MNDPYRIDRRRIRAAFAHAATGYATHAVLQQEMQRRLLERLDYIRLQPRRVLDLGCGPNGAFRPLRERYGRIDIVSLDSAWAMTRQVRQQRHWWQRPLALCADMQQLPLVEYSIDLAFSVAALQWAEDLDSVFAELRRVIAPEGLCLFATFGPDTLRELRQVMGQADQMLGRGVSTHVNRFIDMHDIGDALVRAGFADPVMDQESLTVTYPDLKSLLGDLRGIGVRNTLAGRSRGLTGRHYWQQVEALYRQQFAHDGLLPTTWEVVYGHAWVPDAPPPSRHPLRSISIRPAGAGVTTR